MTDAGLVVARGVSKKYATRTRAAIAHGARDLLGAVLGRNRHDEDLRAREFWALKGVDLDIGRGESVGILGANGAGKSTLLRILYGLTKPNEGVVEVHGRVGGLLDLGTGFDPVLTGRENALAELSLHGHEGSETDALDQIIDFADIGAFIDAPVRTYSQGMRLRLGYAITAFLDPDLLLVDEVLSVGDTAFREKCAHHIRAYLERGGSMLFVSHSVWMVQALCERAIVLDHGEVTFRGTATDAIRHYLEVQSLPESGEIVDDTFHSEQAVPPITIESVVVEAAGGDHLAHGEPATITIDYDSTEAFSDTVWALMIATGDDLAVLTGAMTDEWGSVEVGVGRGRLRCLIPALPLAAGDYRVRVGALDAETRLALGLHGFGPEGTRFRVEGSAPSALFERLAGAPITKLDVDWAAPAPSG